MSTVKKMHEVMKLVSFVAKEDKKVNNNYTFVSHDAVTSAIREACLKVGLVIYQDVKSHEMSGNITVVTTEINIIDVDKPEDRVVVTSFGYGVDAQDKGPGKAMSYAFKYGLLKAFMIETGDDPERDNIPRAPETNNFAPKFLGNKGPAK